MKMGKRLLLVGGGHAHMMTLAAIHEFIEKGYEVSVIGPSPYHFYSGMGPGMLGKIYTPYDIRFATKSLVEKQKGNFILGKAASIDPKKKIVYLKAGDEVPYDVVSFNSGSQVIKLDVEGDTKNIYTVKPIENLKEAQERIEVLLSDKPVRVVVVGGGPSATEIAGNVWRIGAFSGKNTPEIMVFAGNKFMDRFSDKIQKKAFKSLTGRGIKIYERTFVKKIKSGSVILETGEEHTFDFLFLALGIKPSPIFETSGLPAGPDGGLLVNKYLQSTAYSDIFGGGDCIYFQDQPLAKVGVYAVRQNPVLLHNLMAQLEGKALLPFDPGGDYLQIFNMGDGTGIFYKKGITFSGKLAFMIKDYIDGKFMKKFQAYE